MTNVREKSNIEIEKKEYPEMTFEQIQKMVELLNQGKTEEEARNEAVNHV